MDELDLEVYRPFTRGIDPGLYNWGAMVGG